MAPIEGYILKQHFFFWIFENIFWRTPFKMSEMHGHQKITHSDLCQYTYRFKAELFDRF